ncbi:MAG: LptF/LptG family permease [Alphaproteobacteria bacterium]
MRVLDRYILAETLKPLGLALGVVLVALLLERLLRLLDLLSNKGGPFVLVLRMIANLVPHYMGMALPAALFIAVFAVASRLSARSEIDAAYAMGVGLGRVMAPLIVFALLLTVLSLALFGWLQPHSRYAYRAILHLVTSAAWNATLEPGRFIGDDTLTLTASAIDAENAELRGVFLDQRDGRRGTTTTARLGRVQRSADGEHVVLALVDGIQIRTGPEAGDPSVLRFDALDVVLDIGGAAPPFRLRGEGERELTLGELWSRLREGDADRPGVRAEFHARLVRAFSLVVLPFVAAPFGLAAKRTRQASGLVAALIVLLIYHHVLQFGQSLAELGHIPAAPALWVPFGAFTSFAVVLFRRVARQPGNNPLDAVLDALEATWRRLAAHRDTAARSVDVP